MADLTVAPCVKVGSRKGGLMCQMWHEMPALMAHGLPALKAHSLPAILAHNLLAQVAQLSAALMAPHLTALNLGVSTLASYAQGCTQDRPGTTAEVVADSLVGMDAKWEELGVGRIWRRSGKVAAARGEMAGHFLRPPYLVLTCGDGRDAA